MNDLTPWREGAVGEERACRRRVYVGTNGWRDVAVASREGWPWLDVTRTSGNVEAEHAHVRHATASILGGAG